MKIQQQSELEHLCQALTDVHPKAAPAAARKVGLKLYYRQAATPIYWCHWKLESKMSKKAAI